MTDRTVVYEFGEFRLDPMARVFARQDQPIALPPKSFDLLMLLVEGRGRVLERGQLIRELWPDAFVEEANVTFQVSALRKALGEDGSKWIETVPKHGYRFTAPIREVRPADTRNGGALTMPPAAGARPGAPIRGWTGTGLALVAVVATFVAFWYASRPDSPVPGEIRLEAVPLTSYPGYEAEPTFSPDGSQVAFTWDGENQDNYDIYVKAIGAEQPRQLTFDRARDGSPAWSPDGTRIAFLRDKPGGGSEVRLIASTGGADQKIGEVQGLADQGLSWHPDGRSLAVVDRSSPGELNGIFALNIVTGLKTKLTSPTTHDMQPAFSPDGRTLAFTRQLMSPEFSASVHVVPLAGGEPKEVVPTSVGPRRGRLAWIRGGREILFPARLLPQDGGSPRPSSFGGASSSLWSVPVEGRQARPLGGTERAVDVAVSRDGHRLVYSQGTLNMDIWRLDLRQGRTTEEAQTGFAPSNQLDANPQFSPDGERVAFTSQRSGQIEIWVVDGQGKHPLKLTSLGREGDAACPRWSPDGQWIAFDFTAKGGNNVDIYKISAAGGIPKRVTKSPALDSLASWSRDGRFIYFGSNRDGQVQVWKVPASGEEPGNAQQVTRGGGFAAIESTNGPYVYFTKRASGTPDPRNALWRIPVDGGDEEVVVERWRSSHGNWDLTADGLYYVDEEASGTNWVVHFKGFDGRPATVVARLRYTPFFGGPAISVSRDGRWLLSTQRQEDSDLMLVEKFR